MYTRCTCQNQVELLSPYEADLLTVKQLLDTKMVLFILVKEELFSAGWLDFSVSHDEENGYMDTSIVTAWHFHPYNSSLSIRVGTSYICSSVPSGAAQRSWPCRTGEDLPSIVSSVSGRYLVLILVSFINRLARNSLSRLFFVRTVVFKKEGKGAPLFPLQRTGIGPNALFPKWKRWQKILK